MTVLLEYLDLFQSQWQGFTVVESCFATLALWHFKYQLAQRYIFGTIHPAATFCSPLLALGSLIHLLFTHLLSLRLYWLTQPAHCWYVRSVTKWSVRVWYKMEVNKAFCKDSDIHFMYPHRNANTHFYI